MTISAVAIMSAKCKNAQTYVERQLIIPKVRSLSGSQATVGNNITNADVLKLITVGLLESFAPRRVKQYNDRIYLSRYRRSYWLGTRYFHLDNEYYLPTRETCIYHMNETERRDLEYEDGLPIDDIVYQCQRYVQYCCGLDCCVAESVKERNDWYAPPQYPWEYPSSIAPVDTFDNFSRWCDKRSHVFLHAESNISVPCCSFLMPPVIRISEESFPYCPNAQKPKVNPDGSVLQCLPGQKQMCGKGYACFFSGFNYQCCPSEEDDDSFASLECPAPALTILDGDGGPIRCNPATRPCPQKSMVCMKSETEMICCEDMDHKEDQGMKAAAKESRLPSATDMDCPDGAFTILDDRGHPVLCDDNSCAQDGRFCHKKHGVSVCCEHVDKVLVKHGNPDRGHSDEDAQPPQNPLKYTPSANSISSSPVLSEVNTPASQSSKLLKLQKLYLDGTAKLKRNKQTGQKSNSAIGDGSLRTSSPHNIGEGVQSLAPLEEITDNTTPNKQNEYDTSELLSSTPSSARSTVTEDSPSSTTETSDVDNAQNAATDSSTAHTFIDEHERSRGVPLSSGIELIPTETVLYTPHSSGGYAVSRAFSVKTTFSRDDAREYARKYLMRQIRNGWPYSDRYYVRPGMSANGIPLPSAHVVFQNE
uniref:Chitin-binding type-2 domain-containing protein n=1 Tax=Ascaris lumbricoides TaxID=6252 RepID=A0A0M3HV32_ASCLU